MRRVLALLLLVAVLAPGSAVAKPDPRWVFYTDDKTWYTSPWFGGKHRIMIPFGCTEAPYYSPTPGARTSTASTTASTWRWRAAPSCTPPGGRPSSTRHRWGRRTARHPLLLRTEKWDLVIGHVRKRYVEPGDVVPRGRLIALASDNGAPDGCHLHFEKRAPGGGLDSATYPKGLLDLEAVVP